MQGYINLFLNYELGSWFYLGVELELKLKPSFLEKKVSKNKSDLNRKFSWFLTLKKPKTRGY
jgi:hypothetical protein